MCCNAKAYPALRATSCHCWKLLIHTSVDWVWGIAGHVVNLAQPLDSRHSKCLRALPLPRNCGPILIREHFFVVFSEPLNIGLLFFAQPQVYPVFDRYSLLLDPVSLTRNVDQATLQTGLNLFHRRVGFIHQPIAVILLLRTSRLPRGGNFWKMCERY